MPSSNPSGGRTTSLTAALRLLRERWWVLVVCLVVGAAVMVALDQRKTDQYEATSTLLFGTAGSNVSGLLNQAASSSSGDPQRDQGTTLLLVSSSAVADRVKAALRYPGAAGDLSGQVTASAEPDANLIDVTATDPDPRRAALLANTFAQQYQRFRQDADRSGYERGAAQLQSQYDQLPTTAIAQRQTLRNSITALQSAAATAQGGVEVVDRAVAPISPSSPRPKRDGAVGAILGLAVGALLVFGLDLFDRRLKTVADFEEAYGRSVAAAVPLRRRPPQNARERLAVLEPFRILRASLGQMVPGGNVEVVLVTSAVTGEGKSTTAAGLARALALAGEHVVLVEMDLRRPTFHQQFDLGADARGLAGVLLGRVSLDEVLRPGVADFPTLEVLPAGGIPPRSAELLGGREMGLVLDELAERFDVVVLDAPPLLPVADTRVLLDARKVDVVVLVGRPFLTTRDQAARARSIVEPHARLEVDLVLNGLRGDEKAYEYSYERSSEHELPGVEDFDDDRPAARPTPDA